MNYVTNKKWTLKTSGIVFGEDTDHGSNILQNVTSYSYYTLNGLQGIYTYDNLFDDHATPFNRISFVFQLLSFYTLPYDPGEDGSFTKIMALSNINLAMTIIILKVISITVMACLFMQAIPSN
jgi:hypothetical protein